MVSKELNDRLERSVQENSAMVELQTALNGERLRTCSSHVFTNPEFSICNLFFEKKLVVFLEKNNS